MEMMQQSASRGMMMKSTVGERRADAEGSPVAGCRMDPSGGYGPIPGLLEKVINTGDEEAWNRIIGITDGIYVTVGTALSALEKETGFAGRVKTEIDSGKRLLIKPNLVGPVVIHPGTHGEDLGAPICTDWPVIAALMRWFHDTLGISYHQMALGEASTSAALYSGIYGKQTGRTLPVPAIFEGRSGEFYGGWPFYFVRRYLAAHHPASHPDDPMTGYEESISGTYLPPGRAEGRLMVYDLNDLTDPSRGRRVPVPDGANYREITLHKVIIGGDPGDPADMREYPGAVLVNVPKLKLHAQDLITNALKNLGIGLYPTQCPATTGTSADEWEYAMPAADVPSFKGKLPHMPWVAEVDPVTDLPLRNGDGTLKATRTAGMPGTQADVIRAVQTQGVFLIHLSDAIDIINLNHNPEGIAVRVPEGYIWASLDAVALDLLTARYCFKTLPMAEAIPLQEKNHWNCPFVHLVPVARVEGDAIITTQGPDSPLFRYHLYEYAEGRGIGKQRYYVTGWDQITNTPLVSLDGHLGRVDGPEFVELMTRTMYYNPSCMLWDMQRTLLSYAAAHDERYGTEILQAFMDGFDENRDGVIDYDENGRKGFWSVGFAILSRALQIQVTDDEYGLLRGGFYRDTGFMLKHSDAAWNSGGHDFSHEYMLMWIATRAYDMAQAGDGRWPSWEEARWSLHTGIIYGSPSPDEISLQSLYGMAFQFADKTGNAGGYTGSTSQQVSDPESIRRYAAAVSGGAVPLDFTLYLPEGYGFLGGVTIPNVTETADPAKIFTAVFGKGREIW